MSKPRTTDFLKSLGDTSEEVAESLRKLGVKGKTTRYGDKCPIAIAVMIIQMVGAVFVYHPVVV